MYVKTRAQGTGITLKYPRVTGVNKNYTYVDIKTNIN
jgi:hypothetical protein